VPIQIPSSLFLPIYALFLPIYAYFFTVSLLLKISLVFLCLFLCRSIAVSIAISFPARLSSFSDSSTGICFSRQTPSSPVAALLPALLHARYWFSVLRSFRQTKPSNVAMSISYGTIRFFKLLTKLYRIQLQRVSETFYSSVCKCKSNENAQDFRKKSMALKLCARIAQPVLKTEVGGGAVTLKQCFRFISNFP
jgi:hypothetical protein